MTDILVQIIVHVVLGIYCRARFDLNGLDNKHFQISLYIPDQDNQFVYYS